MSNPMYNPFAPGKQMPSQGPYRRSDGQMEGAPRRPPHQLGPGSGFSSSGSSSVNRGPSGGTIPSLLSLPVNYKAERNKMPLDEDIDRCLELQISRAREEAMQTSASQGSQFTNVQRDTFPSVNTGMPSHLKPTTQAKRSFAMDSSDTSMDWAPAEEPSKIYPSASSSFRGAGGGGIQPFVRLGNYDASTSEKSPPPWEEAQPIYSSESATNILLQFGLQREDLEQLNSFPEDQITPQNLPFILRQIRLEKEKRTSAAVQSTSYSESQPIRSVGQTEPLVTSREPVMNPIQKASAVVQQSKVIDYGHTSKSELSFGRLKKDTDLRQHISEFPKTLPSKKSGPTHQAAGKAQPSNTSSNLTRGVHPGRPGLVLIGSNAARHAASKAQPSKTSSNLMRGVHPGRPGLVLIGSDAESHAGSKAQPSKTSSNLMRGVHPGRPGLVLIGSNAERHKNSSDQRRPTGQALKAAQGRGKNTNKGKSGQKQVHQHPPQPKGFPATKPPPLLLVPCHPAPPTRGPSQMEATGRVGSTKHLPTLDMMEDYSAATPRLFPHTCSLCMKKFTSLKDWLSHQNTGLHLENCRLLRGRYPEWDGKTPEFLSASGIDTQPAPATSGQNLRNRHQRSTRGSSSCSLSPRRQRGSEDRNEKLDRREKRFSPSRSYSPDHYHSSESRRERRSSRSWSPQSPRHVYRSRSRSYERRTSSRHRSRSRSYERRSSSWSREARSSSPRRSYERRSPQRRRSDDTRSSPRRSHERRSSDRRSGPQGTRSRSAERLAKRVLDKTGVQSLSKRSDLEAMVKTLAPVLLAELANLKSSSSSAAASSSSSSRTIRKTPSTKSSKTTSSRLKSRTNYSTMTDFAAARIPSSVTLSCILKSISHGDVVEAMEKFGKVKSVVMFRSTLKARVQFEREEDAKKVQSLRECKVKGFTVCVDRPLTIASKKPLVKKEQKTTSQKTSGATKSQGTKYSIAGKVKESSSSESKKTTTGKLVTKAKVLVSKAKSISTKQVAKTVNKASANGKSAGKSVGKRREASSVAPKSKTPGKKPPVDQAKKTATNEKSVRADNKPAAASKKASEVTKQSSETVKGMTSASKPQAAVKIKEGSGKASSAIQLRTESSAKDPKSTTGTEDKRKRHLKKANTQQGSGQKESLMSSVSPSDRSVKEKKPTPQTCSAVSQKPPAVPAGSSTVTPDSTNAAEPPHVDENTSKVLTPEVQKHKLTKETKSESKDSESTTKSTTTPKDAKRENTRDRKDGNKDVLDFSSGDFVTVDEISEDVDDVVVDDHSSSKPTSRETKDTRSFATGKTSTARSASSSSSSKHSKGTTSSRSSSNKQKSSSEPKKSENKASSARGSNSSSTTSVSKSVKSPSSSAQKAQSDKSKPAVKPSEPSSSGLSGRLSASASKSSVKAQQISKNYVKPTKGAAAKVDHHVSAESCSVDSALTMKTSEKNQPAGRQITKNLETDVGDETVKEMKKSEATDGKSTEQNKNDQILDSPNQTSDQQKNKEDDQDRKTETQISGPEKDQIIHHGDLQVVDKKEAHSDECHEMEIEESTKIQSGDPKDQTPTDDGGDQETKGPEGSAIRATSDMNPVASEDTNQTLNNSGAAANVKQKDEIVLSDKLCETSKEVGQISNEEHHNDDKDAFKDQKLVVPTDLLSKAGDESTEEEVYQVIDSLEDQPTKTTETESETEKKEQRKRESTTTSGDGDRPTRQSRSRSKTSKSEEKEKPLKQQDKTIRKYPTRTKDSKTKEEKKSPEDFEEMVYEVVDSIEDDSVQDSSTTESSGWRRPARGHKKDEKTSTPVEEPKKPEKGEEMFTVLDSLEEESPSDKPVVRRSARGRRETTAKKVEGNAKTKEDMTPPTRRRTPARDSLEKDGEKTTKESTPRKSEANQSNTNEDEATVEELDAVEGDQPTAHKRRRGRPKKDNKTGKKQTEEEEEPVYQIVDSLEGDDPQENPTMVASSLEESEIEAEMAGSLNTVTPLMDVPQQATGMVDKEDPPAEGSHAEKMRDTSKTDLKKEEKSSLNEPNGNIHTSGKGEESPKANNATPVTDVSLKLDQLSGKEENAPDDAPEEAELKKRQTAATKTENDQEDKGSLEGETRDHRSQSSDEGGESGKPQSGEKQNNDADMEKMEDESAILCEKRENEVWEAGVYDRETIEGDREVCGTEEDRREKEGALEGRPQAQESQSADEDKMADEEETVQTSSSSKRKHDKNTAVDERKDAEPEAKRFRSQSPSVPDDFQLPPFNPKNPLGEEFVVPKSGFFCNLCSIFYLNETTAKKVHCSSQKHYDNLQKHYQKLRRKTTTQGVQDGE